MAIRLANGFVIPDWVRDHESFRRWARSEEFPEKARASFYHGDLWVESESDMEEFYFHNQIKAEFAVLLLPFAKASRLGRYGTDGMLVSSAETGLSTMPDGFYFSYAALKAGRIRKVAGEHGHCTEFEGIPEMVLQVLSRSSEERDLVDLPPLFFAAGVAEYWLVDARTAEAKFELMKRGATEFVATKKQAGGWLKSDIFGRSFRLTRAADPVGDPEYTVEMK
jgi:Uma2 family endonuclease